jgi:hypothetical protein
MVAPLVSWALVNPIVMGLGSYLMEKKLTTIAMKEL